MKTHNKILGIIGLFIFFLIALYGILFFAGLNWANLEGSFYFGYTGGADSKLNLTCPRIVTPLDSAYIVAVIPNKTDRVITPAVESQISGQPISFQRQNVSVEPGKSQEIKWKVGPEDVAFGHLIMAEVYQYAYFAVGTAMATCGGLFLNLPFISGLQLYYLSIALIVLLTVGGILLWHYNTRRPGMKLLERGGPMLLLLVFILIGIIVGSLGIWILGAIALALSIVLFIVLLGLRLSPSM